MFENFLSGYEIKFLINIIICLIGGILIGVERESRKKSAGISTHVFVIAGAMVFTMLSISIAPNNPDRIAAGIVTGIGFLGAGIILKESNGDIINLTTAASIWFSAAIGMLIGFGWYLIAILCIIFTIFTPRIPHLWGRKDFEHKKPGRIIG